MNKKYYRKGVCLLCDNPANSGEHVFPAALGGRRTNNKLYCHYHNQKLGFFVGVINGNFSLFNSLLDVRPDREETRKPSIQQGVNGYRYRLKRESVSDIPPSLSEFNDLKVGEKFTLSFSSVEHFQAWKSEQEKSGYRIEVIEKSEVRRVLHTSPISAHVSFDEMTLHSISYLALNAIVNYCQDVISSIDYSNVIPVLLSPDSNSPVAEWDGRKYEDVAGEKEYEFGHTFLFIISAKKKTAKVWVSLFSTFNFMVHIGGVEINKDYFKRLDIDPLCHSAPNDLRISNLKSGLHDCIYNTKNIFDVREDCNRRIEELIDCIQKYNLTKEVEVFVDGLGVVDNASEYICEFVSEQLQVVYYNLHNADRVFFKIVLPQIILQFNGFLSSESKRFDTFMVPDEKSYLGISEETCDLLMKVKGKFEEGIAEIVDKSLDKKGVVEEVVLFLSPEVNLNKKFLIDIISSQWKSTAFGKK
ncbi:hypothetical protein [Klebsiella variicola]|uniref:hypothetical protein n=1 Tax=Klebsiella variicola TaxID=244366 RepID=UPI001013D47E|nr:hypothetical protein [Klebsiella variicola]